MRENDGFVRKYVTLHELMDIDIYILECMSEICVPNKICHYHYESDRQCFSLHYVSKGKGMLYIEERKYPVTAGQIFIVPPYVEITYIADKRDPWRYSWVKVGGNKAKDLMKIIGLNKNHITRSVNNERVAEIMYEMVEYYRKYDADNLGIVGYLFLLLDEIVKGRKIVRDKARATSAQKNIIEATVFIRHNFMNKITVSDIAKSVGITPSYLNALFKKEMGMSCGKYLCDCRMREAKRLLLNGELQIGYIAQCCGFDDQLYFSRKFHREEGVSPTEYRERNKEIILPEE